MKILYIDSETNKEVVNARAAWLKFTETDTNDVLVPSGHIVDICSSLKGPDYKHYDLVIINLGQRCSEFNLRPELIQDDHGLARISIKTPVVFAGADSKDTLLALTHAATTCKLHELSQSRALAGILDKAAGGSRVHS